MATTVTTSSSTTSTRNLVSVNSIMYIRPIVLTMRVSGCRPNTFMNVYFDSTNMNHAATPIGSSAVIDSTKLVTDSNGFVTFTMAIPGGTFTTGNKQILVTDAASIALLETTGSTYGSATAFFTSSGAQQVFQTISTTVRQNTVTTDQFIPAPPVVIPPPVVVAPAPVPLPAIVQPAPVFDWNRWDGGGGQGGNGSDPLAQSFFTYGKTGGAFLTSIEIFFQTKDSTIPVRVELRDMVNGYPASGVTDNELLIVYKNPSDVSVSTDASVGTKFTFKYPVYLEQDKDYCFVVFSNSKQYHLFTSKLGEASIETGRTIFEQPYVGTLFKSSNNITWNAEQFEDIKFNMKIAQFDISASATIDIAAKASYFAIPGVSFSTETGSSVITYKQSQKHGLSVSDKIYVVSDQNATYNGISTADLSGNRTVTDVVDEYTVKYDASANALSSGVIRSGGQVKRIIVTAGGSGYTVAPTVQLSSTSGSGATATAVLLNGSVVDIKITSAGTGYSTPPTILITGGDGTGAAATVLIDAMFSVITNKPTNFIVSNIPTMNMPGTSVSATVSTTQLNFPGGNLSTYVPAETLDMNVQGKTMLNINAVVASPQNETANMSGNPSLLTNFLLRSSNPNVSPILDMRGSPTITSYSYKINDQVGENVGGSNPLGTANTELDATGGTALAKYYTKKQGLTTPSTGILLMSDIYSQDASRVEWYVRTSVASSQEDFDTLPWQLLTSDRTVNRSTLPGQFWSYEFYLYDIPTFDTYALKAVLRTTNPAIVPIVNNYSVIVSV